MAVVMGVHDMNGTYGEAEITMNMEHVLAFLLCSQYYLDDES
jgi:hypothetical protein